MGKSGQFSVTVGIGFLSVPFCATVTEEEVQKEGILLGMKLHHMKGRSAVG